MNQVGITGNVAWQSHGPMAAGGIDLCWTLQHPMSDNAATHQV